MTALNLELKHHPLKEENAQLKKRIMVEQEKARTEQRRLKQKIHDLTIKINDLSEKCGPSATGQAISGKPSVVSTQTQTESELEKVIEETTKKYQETVRLCRFRAGIIKDLEEKLKQNENVDTSNICSLTNGQISSLKVSKRRTFHLIALIISGFIPGAMRKSEKGNAHSQREVRGC